MGLDLLCLPCPAFAGYRECAYNLAGVPGVQGSSVYRSFKGAGRVKEAGSQRRKHEARLLGDRELEGGMSGRLKGAWHLHLGGCPILDTQTAQWSGQVKLQQQLAVARDNHQAS